MSCGAEVFNKEMKDIEDVLEKMDAFEEFIVENDREGFLPFLEAYRTITLRVNRKQNIFEHLDDLESLDVRFAELYFRAMEKYFLNGEKIRPWKNYLDYMERNDSRPVLELLLGINSHINSDLPQCLSELEYSHEGDFRKFNRILLESLMPVLSEIVLKHRDAESFALMTAQPLPLFGLGKIIHWRREAWKNRDKENRKLKNYAEEKSSDLVSIRHDTSFSGILQKPRKVYRA